MEVIRAAERGSNEEIISFGTLLRWRGLLPAARPCDALPDFED